MNVRKLLVTTDFSDTARAAFEAARTLAGTFGARIVLAHVEEDRMPPLILEYTDVGLEELLSHQEKRARQQLQELTSELGPNVEIAVARGTPHVEIVRLADEQQCDLIVMATHGRGFISHAILGSTTERVLRRAPCPVLVVRGKETG